MDSCRCLKKIPNDGKKTPKKRWEKIRNILPDNLNIDSRHNDTSTYAMRSGKGNQPLNIKIAVERPILKLELPNFRWILIAKLLYNYKCPSVCPYVLFQV